MKLEFHGHDERYIVEQSMMSLFPLEKPVYGAVEPGETESQTAEREVFEETGLRVKIDRRYRAENRYNIRHDTQKLAVIFAAVTDQEQLNPQPEEIAEAVWVPVEQASARLTYERDRRILRDAFAHVTGRRLPTGGEA